MDAEVLKTGTQFQPVKGRKDLAHQMHMPYRGPTKQLISPFLGGGIKPNGSRLGFSMHYRPKLAVY